VRNDFGPFKTGSGETLSRAKDRAGKNYVSWGGHTTGIYTMDVLIRDLEGKTIHYEEANHTVFSKLTTGWRSFLWIVGSGLVR